ncbi:23S rRNA (adenine(2503)-C(2))-methyltransferase RlmN [Paenibacillus yanchengensis]|uniref:Probable dual-specificity RNA methyltransferase RlmN n=1 Tax=Paenibacillus yanchengensis TaxID=2035833 RepID=A0ABW4YPL4_9BACL
MGKASIYGLTLEQLESWLGQYGHKRSRARAVWEQLYRERVRQFPAMAEINDSCQQLLQEHFITETLTEHTRQESSDGTIKFLFKLHDGNLIETVLMNHKFGMSVCVTTQVGCNIGCSFCASGLLAKSRDLTSAEIVEQVMQVQFFLDQRGESEKVSHIVVMGIGEPFDNYDHVSNFVRVMKDHRGLAIGARRITVSTSGLVPKIKQFADSDLNVNLAISLHAPNDELRTRIMKINRAYPLEKLFDAMDYYTTKSNRRITIEYILLRGINDQPEHALQLAELMHPRKKHINVNLIPYNPVDEHSQYERSSKEDIRQFYDVMKKQQISCSVRLEHGTDIDAACGQLRSKQTQKKVQIK